jgi:SAM-dependent methyltransferase
MTNSKELVKKQYDRVIYPNIPIEKSFKNDINLLFAHSIIPSHYKKFQEVISSVGKLILDVGCGSGYTSLLLAEANPGAKIVGVDISEPSVEMARKRLLYHHYIDAEFHAINIEDLPNLGISFDYINCNDTLYLLPDPISALESMQSVLSPQGIIRANLHDLFGRERFLRSQQFWQFLGLMDDAPGQKECDIVREIIDSLQDAVIMKSQAWLDVNQGAEPNEFVFMNHLLQGDCGFTIPQMFKMLSASNLEFISMVNWKHWDLHILFDDKKNIPTCFDAILASNSEEPKLYVYELLNPIDRLLDFWCGHPGQGKSYISVENWDHSIWSHARVFLNPYLKIDRVRSALDKAIANFTPFKVSEFFSHTTIEPVSLSTRSAICLKMVWDRPITVNGLVKRWLRVKPLNLLTLEPMTEVETFAEIKQALIEMEAYMFVMLESSH